jgi:ElaB/YqjD/DUF883 family membrane-anchored ribosome-binding protein
MKASKNMPMSEFETHKEELKDEIRNLESGFELRVKKVKKRVMSTLQPVDQIKKNPFKSVAAAAGIGLLIGLMGRRKKRSNHSAPVTVAPRDGISSFLLSEIKHLAARKAMLYLSDLIDQQISSFRKDSSDS